VAQIRWRGILAITAVVGCSSDSTGPKLQTRPTTATALALGARFSCVLTSDAKSYCWGDDLAGQLGDSSFIPKLLPTASVGGHSFAAIAAGNQTVCALDTVSGVWCWGDDPTQAGIAVSYKSTAVQVLGPPLSSIAAGRKFACGLDSAGTAFCWGENGRGQLGVGDTLPRTTATRVASGLHFASITTGFWHTCALTAAGVAYCWGDNTYGELGLGDTLSVSTPKQIGGSTTFRSITAGSIHECGIATTGSTFCWGANFSGQLGDSTATRRVLPTPVAPGLAFTTLRAGRANSIFSSTCGITAVGDVYCWGWNSKGQLGIPSSHDACVPAIGPVTTSVCSYTPVKATGIANAVSIDVGEQHACVLTLGSQLLCWGENAHGELGDGTGVAQTTPVAVAGGLRYP
jgi:alpha-tubulin suppressor-like RCC1 family protein